MKMRRRFATAKICGYQFRRLITGYRFYVILMLLVVYAILYAAPVSEFAREYNRAVSAIGVFPILTGDFFAQMTLMFGVVLLFSDAPFWEHNHLYLLMRSNRATWARGQILYIALATAVYLLSSVIISWVIMIPNLSFDLEWGKIWMTLATGSADMEVSITVYTRIVHQYSVLSAAAISFVLSWLAGCVIGGCMFLVNAATKSKCGLILGAGACLMNIAIVNSLFDYKLHRFSPLSLSNLHIVDRSGTASGYPSLEYAFAALSLAFVLLAVVIVWSAKHNPRYLEMPE